MTPNAEAESLLIPALNAGDAAKHAEQQKLSHARDLLEEKINAVRANPQLSKEQKDVLIGQLNGARGASAEAIANVLQVVATEMPAAAATSSYEMIGNEQVVQGALINAQLRMDSQRHCEEYARLIVGKNQPEEVVQAVAFDMQHDPELHKAAEAFARATPEERRIKIKNHKATIKTVEQMAHELAENPGASAEEKKYLQDLANEHNDKQARTHVKGNHKALEAIQHFKENHDFGAFKHTMDGLEHTIELHKAEIKQRMIAKGDHHAEAHAAAAANAEADFKNIAEQPSKTILHDLNLSKASNTTAVVNEWHALNTGSDAQRADAYVAAYVNQHKGQTVDQTKLHAEAIKFVTTHTAQTQVVSQDQLIHTAMNAGVEAMYHGDTAKAHALAKQVSDIMRAPGSGYTKDQADVALAILTQGADKADEAGHNKLFGHMGRDELVAVMSDPKKKADLIKLTLQDIQNSKDVHHLQHKATDKAMQYATGALTVNLALDANMVASLTIDHQHVDTKSLGIKLHGNQMDQMREIREALNKAGVNLQSFDKDHNGLSTAELNNAIATATQHVPNAKPAPAKAATHTH